MNKLVEQFCTPPILPLTDFDEKALIDTERILIPFEDEHISCYVKGEGKTIILGHGWGSRASHMALIARFLAKTGFKIVMFDAPAHSSTPSASLKNKSSMFEYCRALYTVANRFSPVHAVISHSLGAISTVFSAAGYKMLSDYRIEAEKFVLISLPVSLDIVFQSFCKQHNLDKIQYVELKTNLEEEFNFSSDDYYVPLAINNIEGNILLIHDEDDEQIPINSINSINEISPAAELFVTKGSGHDKILINRKMIAKIVEFLK